jgi:hypothetical protein
MNMSFYSSLNYWERGRVGLSGEWSIKGGMGFVLAILLIGFQRLLRSNLAILWHTSTKREKCSIPLGHTQTYAFPQWAQYHAFLGTSRREQP